MIEILLILIVFCLVILSIPVLLIYIRTPKNSAREFEKRILRDTRESAADLVTYAKQNRELTYAIIRKLKTPEEKEEKEITPEKKKARETLAYLYNALNL